MKKVQSLVILVASVFLAVGCDGNTSPVSPNNGSDRFTLNSEWALLKANSTVDILEGTSWQLYAEGDVETGSTTPLVLEKCGGCYTLTFNGSGTLDIRLYSDEYHGSYEGTVTGIDKTYNIAIADFSRARRNETGFENRWLGIFPSVRSFALNENELKLYSSDDKTFLLYYKGQ